MFKFVKMYKFEIYFFNIQRLCVETYLFSDSL